MDIGSARDGATADQMIGIEHRNSLAISQLPTELLLGILWLALPEIRFSTRYVEILARSYMRTICRMRSVTKRWQVVIEGTPSFWTLLSNTFPSHVNKTNILRSSELPLMVLYQGSKIVDEGEYPTEYLSAAKFLRHIASTRLRWSTVALDFHYRTIMSDYLGAPLPLLREVVVRSSRDGNQFAEPEELLGGETTNLRVLKVSGVSIDWQMGCFVQLKSLTLKNLSDDSLTGSQLLNMLDASPGLQVLNLKGFSMHIPPPSPIITLHHLKYLKLHSCAIQLVEWICHQILAPSCTKVVLSMDGEQVFDVPRFLNETLKPFHGILRSIHRQLGNSEIELDSDGIKWYGFDYTRDGRGLCVFIEGFFDPLFFQWVNHILQDEPGLQITFSNGATSNEAVLRSLALMRNVTKVEIDLSWQGGGISEALQFLGRPLSTTTSLPSLPCVREVEIPPGDWDVQEVLNMVQSRFHAFLREGVEEPLSTIKVHRGTFISISVPRSILHLTSLVKIRQASGVKRLQIEGWKDPKGMLAVVWDEEISKP
ncbi:hypothetical protein FRC01_006409, partial [Tulasnella sp. 417]